MKYLDENGLARLWAKIKAYVDAHAGGTPSWSDITGKPSTFPPSSHTHDDRYYTESEVEILLNGKANSSHTHDDRYYTETEMDSKLNGKANSNHTHTEFGSLDLNGSTLMGNNLMYGGYDYGGNARLVACLTSGNNLWVGASPTSGSGNNAHTGKTVIYAAHNDIELRPETTSGDIRLYPGSTGGVYIGSEKVTTWVVEKGTSNSWDYIKYSDGTMIAYKNVSASYSFGTKYGSYIHCASGSDGGWVLPYQKFIEPPTIQATCQNGNYVFPIVKGVTTSNFGLNMVRLTNASDPTMNVSIGLIAIGKWK